MLNGANICLFTLDSINLQKRHAANVSRLWIAGSGWLRFWEKESTHGKPLPQSGFLAGNLPQASKVKFYHSTAASLSWVRAAQGVEVSRAGTGENRMQRGSPRFSWLRANLPCDRETTRRLVESHCFRGPGAENTTEDCEAKRHRSSSPTRWWRPPRTP